VLLYIKAQLRPEHTTLVVGELTPFTASEYWVSTPPELARLPCDAPNSERAIWDGWVYRPPNTATHWMPLPNPPAMPERMPA